MEKLEKKLERARSGQTGGKSNALATFEITRPMVGASALGIAQAAYEWTLEYLEDKSDENGPLIEQQRVQQVLADVATEIEAARLLVWRAAWMGRNGMPMTGGQGSMSKLKAGDVTMWATTTLMDLVGDVRADHGLPAGEVVPGRQDLPDLRGHGPGPAARGLAHAARRVQAEERQRGSALAGSGQLDRRRCRSAEVSPQPPESLSHNRGVGFSFDPAVITLLAGATALYVRAVRVLARRGYAVPFWQQVAWHGGIALTAIGLLSPLDGLGEELLIAHMGQHLLIADLAAPLLLIGIRSPVYAFILPRPVLVPLARPQGPAPRVPLAAQPAGGDPGLDADPLRLALRLRLRGRAATTTSSTRSSTSRSCSARCWCGGR